MTNPSGLIPMEWNVVIQLDPTEEKIGSIFIPQSKQDTNEIANEEGMLVAVSPHAFSYADWPEGSRMPQPGDRVLFARYSGVIHERGGLKFRICKDKDVVAIVTPQPSLAAVA